MVRMILRFFGWREGQTRPKKCSACEHHAVESREYRSIAICGYPDAERGSLGLTSVIENDDTIPVWCPLPDRIDFNLRRSGKKLIEAILGCMSDIRNSKGQE